MSVREQFKHLIGRSIRIVRMANEKDYNGRKGVITHVDDLGQLHGTWGGLAIITGIDEYELL